MIFLLEYNRSQGKILRFDRYTDADRRAAEDERLRLELSLLANGLDNEVVLLEADDENALRATHSRYFLNPEEIAST